MKKAALFGLALCCMFSLAPGCKKNKSDSGCGETTLKVSTTPANGSVDPAAPGPNFPLLVNITDGMPSAGVVIDVKARKDSTNSTPYFTTKLDNVTMTSNSITITGTPSGSSCVVNVTVTSKSCNTNQWAGSYRYSAK